jgi:hypothetical protein
MRRTLAVLIVAMLGSSARAGDRAPILDVEGAAGMVFPNFTVDGTSPMHDPAGVGIARAMVSWERPPVPYPVVEGTAAYALDIGPELGVGFIGNDRRGDAFAQAGLRMHLAFAQNSMGLLRISARGGMWLAGRGGVVGSDHDAMIEGDLGWYIWLGSKWRVGWEMGVLGIRNPVQNGAAMPLYIDEQQDVTKIVHFAVFVGSTL